MLGALGSIWVKALGITHALSPGGYQFFHQFRGLSSVIEFGKQVFHHGEVRRNARQVHEAERPRKCDPVAQIIAQ